ncbi:TPA: hypothetical protein O4G09_005230 [Klebsiella michiganensis]|nr:hypothetical protein [Klebsiella michiganensis]
MSREISRNPSFTPSPKLRAHLNEHREGVTERLNNLFDRYDHLVRSCAIPLEPAEKQVLLNVLSGSFVEPSFIECLAQEVLDSDDYAEGTPAAISLYEKCKANAYPALLATIERLGF